MPKAIVACFIALLFSGLVYSQTEPNLETGIKPYGSYHGTDVDTVSIMNGNVTVHIPFPQEYPQRGALHEGMTQISHSKGWHLTAIPPTGGSAWAPDRSLMGAVDNLHPAHQRTLQQFTASGQTFQTVMKDALVTWDGSTHKLMDVSSGRQLAFEAVDGSGWHVSVANPNQYGIPQTAVITDRTGTQYTVPQYQPAAPPCIPSTSGGVSAPGGHPMLLYPNSVGLPDASTFSCLMSGGVTQVTDANGNTFTSSPSTGITDTLGKSTSSIPLSIEVEGYSAPVIQSSNPPGCLGAFSFYGSSAITYPAANGRTNQILVCYANFTIQTSFGFSSAIEYPSSIAGENPIFPLISSIVLPDGSTWTFNYDAYGNTTFIGLPLGGSISYQWATVAFPSVSGNAPVSRAVTQRTITDNNGNSYIWKYAWMTSQNNPASENGTYTNVVTDPLGNDTAHVFTNYGGSFYETDTQSFQGLYTSGQLLKEVVTGYQVTTAGDGNDGDLFTVLPNSIQTTVYPSGKTSLVQKSYDAALTDPTSGTTSYGKVITEKQYDWGTSSPGPLLNEIDTTYEWQVDSTYLTAHFLDLPASVIVKDGNGCSLSETDYTYDEAAYLTPSGIATQHVSPPSSKRGNLTTVTKWLAPAGSCNPKSGTAVPTHTNWFDTGEVNQQIDALGRATTYSYDSAYVGAFPTQTCSPQTGTVTHCVSGTYDFTTGLLTSFSNENATTVASGNTPGDAAHTTIYTYDLMSRLTSATFPPDPVTGTQAKTNFNFPVPIALPFTVTKTRSITPALTDSITSTYDGLGRVYKTLQPTSNGTAEVDTAYDGLDRVKSVTNPYYSTADTTYGSAKTQYDGLGRATQITEQDGSLKTTSYDVTPVQAAPGDCTQSKDEAGNQRLTCADAMGRLIEVHEPGDNFSGTQATGAIVINGPLKSQSGVGATGSVAATAQVVISGTDNSITIPGHQSCTLPPHVTCTFIPGATIYDSGNVVLTVNGTPYQTSFGQNNTPNSAFDVAHAIANLIVSDPNVVVASIVDGSNAETINLQARNAGTSGNSISISTSYSYNTAKFTGPSFTATPVSGNLAGGVDSVLGITVYDQGTASITVGSFTATVPYSSSGNSTAEQVASALATALSASGSPVTASPSGAQVNIVYKSIGATGNVAATFTSTSTQTQWTFNPPSFTAANSTLSGGLNSEGASLDYNYFVTQYSYDGLGNLLQVTQKGDPTVTNSSQWRVRTFTYDSLSRLLTAHNPESGTIAYSYDVDGNLVQKTSPAPNQTGSATQAISYCYDELHRVTKKDYQPHTFSPPACPITAPVVTYTYDSGANAKGRLTGITDQAGTASYVYDVLGRMSSETRVIAGISKGMSYEYNLDGSLSKLHNLSGAVITYTPDSAGRIVSAIDSANSINYATSATYQADGQITGFVSGNGAGFAGITNALTYNKRLQPINMSATSPSQTVFSIGYDFHAGNGTAGTGTDNGNVWNLYNFRDRSRDQSFTYDALNRLTSAQNSGTNCAASTVNGKTEYWGNSYGYDAWGNLTQKVITKCGAENLSLTALANNQLSGAGYGYDAAGNMTSEATEGVSASYDPENRIASATKAGVTTSYAYDSDGNRVEKTGAGTNTLYWYMTPGIVGESDLAGNLKSEYVFFKGERVARKDFSGATTSVFYYFSDHLKTASVVTDSSGTIKAESDYYPWGGELQFVNNDSNHYKFTGKERDTESGLDYFGARYYSNGLGRFITPDWAAKATAVPYVEFADPQSLNLYSYVRNVPTARYDADGHCADHYKDGSCKVNVDPKTGKQGVQAGKQLEGVLNKYDKAVNGLNDKAKLDIKDSKGKVIGSMTGKEVKAVWNGTSFTVTNKSFNNGGAGGGTGGTGNGDSFSGHSELNPQAVSDYANAASARNEAPLVGLSTLTFHELAHETHFGEALTQQYPVTPTISMPRERGTSSAAKRMADAVGAQFDCDIPGGCQ